MNLHSLKHRVRALESAIVGDQIVFSLRDGSRAVIRRKEILEAVGEAIEETPTHRANILLHAVKANDGSRLHELAQAIVGGPMVPGHVNEE